MKARMHNMDTWLNISSVPKTGKRVLLWDGKNEIIEGCWLSTVPGGEVWYPKGVFHSFTKCKTHKFEDFKFWKPIQTGQFAITVNVRNCNKCPYQSDSPVDGGHCNYSAVDNLEEGWSKKLYDENCNGLTASCPAYHESLFKNCFSKEKEFILETPQMTYE